MIIALAVTLTNMEAAVRLLAAECFGERHLAPADHDQRQLLLPTACTGLIRVRAWPVPGAGTAWESSRR